MYTLIHPYIHTFTHRSCERSDGLDITRCMIGRLIVVSAYGSFSGIVDREVLDHVPVWSKYPNVLCSG